MGSSDTSLRLRFWASLLIFVSGYAPLLVILAVKDLQIVNRIPTPQHPWMFAVLIAVAALSSLMVLGAIRSIRSGLSVEVTKAANKSGEMFGYTIPYSLPAPQTMVLRPKGWQQRPPSLAVLATG